jgi:hypothetical protein
VAFLNSAGSSGALDASRYRGRHDHHRPAPSHPGHPPLPEGAGPRAIRAALLGQEQEEFDQAYRRALAEAAETLELAGVLDTLE